MGLTEKQIQHIISLLQNGKELPDDYRNVLFPPEKKSIANLFMQEKSVKKIF